MRVEREWAESLERVGREWGESGEGVEREWTERVDRVGESCALLSIENSDFAD